MANKMIPGASASLFDVGSVRPSGDDGIDMSQFHGGARPDRWMISAEIIDSDDTPAELTPPGNYDSVLESKVYGGDGNGITFSMIGDSPDGTGVVIEEDVQNLTLIVHYESEVSTVGDVDDAITNSSDLVSVKTPGTVITVLDAETDNVDPVRFENGADDSTTFDLYIWGRNASSKRWGLIRDSYGVVKNGELLEDATGRTHLFIREIGNFDRVAFTRDDSADGEVNVTLTEIYMVGTGN